MTAADDYLREKGWEAKERAGELVVRECPLCHDTKWHFYINSDTGLWKCHKCNEGGGLVGLKRKLGDISEQISESNLDAFVIDVPEPEKAVRTASRSLAPGGRFCSYVPTSNQMERVFIALRGSGFEEVRAMELMERGYSVKEGATRPVTEMLSHTGFLVFARWPGLSEP
jgi:hypothetical protein